MITKEDWITYSLLEEDIKLLKRRELLLPSHKVELALTKYLDCFEPNYFWLSYHGGEGIKSICSPTLELLLVIQNPLIKFDKTINSNIVVYGSSEGRLITLYGWEFTTRIQEIINIEELRPLEFLLTIFERRLKK